MYKKQFDYIYIVILCCCTVKNISTRVLHECSNKLINSNGNNALGEEWFRWSQYHSFCMKYDIIHGSSTQLDKECSTQNCKECMYACKNGSFITKQDCQSNCTTDPCKHGCEFFIQGETADFKPNLASKPTFTDVNITHQRIEDDTIFNWQSTIPPQSVYLVTIMSKTENILVMTTDNTYNVGLDTICSKTNKQTNYVLCVYPINSNGWTKDTVARSESIELEIPSITDIIFGQPIFSAVNDNIGSIGFPLTPKSSSNISDIIIKYEASCNDGRFVPAGHRSIGDAARQWEHIKQNETIIFQYDWTSDDPFKGCELTFVTYGTYDNCFKTSEYTKILKYNGCETVKNYPEGICDSLSSLSTTFTPLILNKTLTHSSLICTAYKNETCIVGITRNTTCEICVKGHYGVNVTWPHVNPELFDEYELRYGPAIKIPILGPYVRPESLKVSYLLPNATYFFISNGSEAGSTFGISVMLYHEKSKQYINGDAKETAAIDLPALSKPEVHYEIRKDKVPVLSNNSTTKGIMIGIIIPVAFLIVFLILYLLYRKHKSMKDLFKETIHKYETGMEAKNVEKPDEWEIVPTAITLDEKIGEGAFGTVFSAKLNSNLLAQSKYAKHVGGAACLALEKNPKVAVKLLKEGATEGEYTDFKEEITLMKSIGYHKNIVNMIGCSTVRQPLCLIVEFMQHGDLLHYLRKRRSRLCASETIGGESGPAQGFMYTKNFEAILQSNTSAENSISTGQTSNSNYSLGSEDSGFYDPDNILTPAELLCFAWQIASGMEYLALNNLVHRDLAARNVLIGLNKLAKISDFGLTRQVGSELVYMSSKNQKLPIKWMSVEAIFDQIFTTYSDVWAYGVVLFEIVTLGGTPYPTISNRELLNLLSSGFRIEKPKNCADPMYDIMLHCWNEDPLQRPTFTELRDHLEEIMSQGSHYLTFDIDEKNVYYNVASFKSIPSDTEDDIRLEEEILRKPAQIKTIDELRHGRLNSMIDEEKSNETETDERYTIVGESRPGESHHDKNADDAEILKDRYTGLFMSSSIAYPTRGAVVHPLKLKVAQNVST